MSQKLTHLNDKGEAHIVDIGGKAITARRAIARARIDAKPETVEAIACGTLKKGDALAWPASPASWPPRRRPT